MSNKIQFTIPAIKCSGCVTAIEKALNDKSGVIRVDVDLETKSALVESDVSQAVLIDTIKSVGYDVTETSSE